MARSEDELRTRFLKTYASVPLNYRDEIVAIVKIGETDQPVSWAAAYVEVINTTEKGAEILKKMGELNLLGGD
ncbi:MAG: hypothetical protein V1708_02795 [Candidatus Micrarchaeota archaeon]